MPSHIFHNASLASLIFCRHVFAHEKSGDVWKIAFSYKRFSLAIKNERRVFNISLLLFQTATSKGVTRVNGDQKQALKLCLQIPHIAEYWFENC